ncbi:putative holin-like toxin [Shouchella shacheensis]
MSVFEALSLAIATNMFTIALLSLVLLLTKQRK